LNIYEEEIKRELYFWKLMLLDSPNVLQRVSKRYQIKIHNLIPKRVNELITSSVKGIVQTTIFGWDLIPKEKPKTNLSLEERDKLANELLIKYKKIAAVEGAGTGFGGFILGTVDFPALIAIKMKFLFELAHIYGYNTQIKSERVFLLYIFQLAFSEKGKRKALLDIVEDWDIYSIMSVDEIDWEKFQKDYRDSIDFRKMLQIIPVVGAAVGIWANYSLLDELGKIGINCYRMRVLNFQEKEE